MKKLNFFIIVPQRTILPPMIVDLYLKREMRRIKWLYGRYLKMLLATVLTIIALFYSPPCHHLLLSIASLTATA
jgi:hypothetical protein